MKRMKKVLATLAAVAVCGLFLGAMPALAAGGDGQPGAQAAPAKAPRATKKAPPQGKVNLNTATVEQLQGLPRVGPAMAKRIVEYRTANKGFKTVEELRNVKGIGPKVFESLKPYLTL